MYVNRVDDRDTTRLEQHGYHLPSLSAGDIIIRQLPIGVTYHVLGFNEITQKQYLAIRRDKDPQRTALQYTI